MKKLLILLSLILVLFPSNANAIANTATSAIVMDMDTGRILYQKNINEQRLIASITKIMTAVVAIENGTLTDIVTAGEEILSMYGTNIYIELGEHMILLDLLYGLLLRSGNDAAVVIANHICESEEEFVKLMNAKAKELGMTRTSFSNSHGLDEITQNYSTAYDMALLSSYANKLPIYRQISDTKKWVVETENKTYVWYNRNKLLTLYKDATGGKNGYTPKSGRTLVTTASRNGLNLTAVTLNDPNEYDSHMQMYDYVFNKYQKYEVLNQYTFKINDTLYKNRVYINESFYYPLTKDEIDQLNITARMLNKPKDNKVGTIEVVLNDKTIYTNTIYLRKEKIKKNAWQRIKEWFKSIF